MISKDSVDWGLDAGKFTCVIPFQKGPKLDIHYVSAKEYKVRSLCINKVNPPGKLRPSVAVAKVKVTGKNHGKRLLQGFLSLYGKFFPVFLLVVDAAKDKHHGNDSKKACKCESV